MSKKQEYLDRLLNTIKSLENSVSVAKREGTLSFSFFRDSFKKGQEISSLIHELEMFQVEDMKQQMEKLIVILSEEDNKTTTDSEVIDSYDNMDAKPVVEYKVERELEQLDNANSDVVKITEPKPVESDKKKYSESIILPTYINPNIQLIEEVEVSNDTKETNTTIATETIAESNHSLSLNDIVKTAQPKVDVKRGFSLNDRFYFQRELFNNDREAMNAMMTELNAFNTSESIEEYLKSVTSWDFENDDVKSFLDIVSRSLN